MKKEEMGVLLPHTVERRPAADRLASVGKMVDSSHGVYLEPSNKSLPAACYDPAYIRPLAVSPLNHPESEPNPRGFLFSAVLQARAAT